MWWFWDWVSEILNYLGFANKTGKLLFIGLDNAGKTTLLRRLKDGCVSQNLPTLYPTSEELTLGGIRFTTFDLGGHELARRIWRDYFPAADAIVFLVDCAARHRVDESRNELEGILSDEQIAHCPVLVLGNKIDVANAISEDELKWYMGITKMCTGKGQKPKSSLLLRPMEVFMCSVTAGVGYGDGFRWLSQYF